MGKWVKQLAFALVAAVGISLAPVWSAPALATGSTLLTTLGSPCTHNSRNIVRSNVTFSFLFTAGSAETIGEFYLQRSSGTQAYDTLLWLDIYSGSTLLGTLNPAPALTYSSGGYVFTALSGSVALPSAGTYTALMRGGGANHYFCEAQDANSYGAAITLDSTGSAAGWAPVEMARYAPNNYYSTYPLVKFVSGIDTAAPSLSSTQPSSNATGVTRSPLIQLNFSENLVSGSGQIQLIRSSDSAVVASWSPASAQIAGSSINLTLPTPLDYGTQFHLLIDAGFVKDASNNAIASITSSSAIRFTTIERDLTPPVVSTSSPSPWQIGVNLTPRFAITFSENVTAGSGVIQLRRVSDSSLVASASSQSFVVSGNGLTWIPAVQLSYSTSYYLTLTAGTVQDLSDDRNQNIEVSDSVSLRFTTLIEPDNSAPTLTLSAKISTLTSNSAVFVVSGNEPLNCNSISTINGVDFSFGSFTTISQIVSVGNTCEISVQTAVAQGASLTISLSPTASFAVSDISGNVQSSISGTPTITISVPAPAPTPAPTPAPVATSGYSGWNVSAGTSNWVRPGQTFQMVISLTCNDAMSLNSAPYYPSMYYMVMSSPWLNGYLQAPPQLSDDKKTATWTVTLTAPSTPGEYEMYAYGRGTVCFGDGYNFANSARQKLVVNSNAPTVASSSNTVSPSTSASVSPTTSPGTSTNSSNAAAGYSNWNLSVTSDGQVSPGEQIQLVVSITCNREMKLNGAPYYPSMYYYLNSQPRLNGVYGRPVLSNGGKTATWTVGVIAPSTVGKYVFQAYGRDNPFGSTCFGDNYNFTYSPGTFVEVTKAATLTASATVSPVPAVSPGYSSWKLTATGEPALVANAQLKLSVTLVCNVAMASNKAPYYPSMYYLVNSPNRINGVYGAPVLSRDGKSATWTVTVPAPSAGTYTFVAYARDNPTGGTCFGDSYNFAYSNVEALTVAAAPEPSPSPTATPTPLPSLTPTPTPSSTPSETATPTSDPTPSETVTAQETSSAPIFIVPSAMPNAVFVSGSVVQIQPLFLLAAAEALAETVAVDETAVVRFRLGSGAWQESTVAELRLDDTPIELAAEVATGELEIQIVSALSQEPIGVVTYDLEATNEGVVLTIQEPQPDYFFAYLAAGLGFLTIFGFVLLLVRRRRSADQESPLTSA